jgi:hypothetical protein
VPGGGEEGGEGDEGGGDIDGEAEHRPHAAEAELPEDRDRAEAHRGEEGNDQLGQPEAEEPAARGEEHRARDDDRRAGEDRHGHGLPEEDDGEPGGDEGIEVDQRRRDRRAHRLDAQEAEQATRRGADEASEDEVEDPPDLDRVRWRQHEDGEPQARGADDEVDPVAGERVGPPEALTDEDGRHRAEDRAPEREEVDEGRQRGVP